MDLLKQFEYPLPGIAADIERISFETSGPVEGSFTVSNTGGGELNGYITSDTDSVVFSPSKFEGNTVEVAYRLNMDVYKPGEYIDSSVIVVSNGGELVIPVKIEIIPPEIYARDGTRITSLMDYMFYVKQNPVASRQLFTQKEFMMWLVSMNYEHIELYERFITDSNKERAVDNFLVLNKLKRKAKLSIVEKDIVIKVRPYDNEPLTGVIPVKISGWGHVDLNAAQAVKNNRMKLLCEKISFSDFDENGIFDLTFVVYPGLIKKPLCFEKVIFSGDIEESCLITVIKENAIEVSMSKECYGTDDSGKLHVKNRTLRDIMLGIVCSDSFVKFSGKRYLIGAEASIDFDVKLSALQSAQMSLKKQSIVNSVITVKSLTEGIRYQKDIVIDVGNIL